MDNACIIAAIPSVGDRAHKASSEPLAHMTMLYLDRAVVESNLENVLLHVQHVADTNWTSGLVVDRRGTLGSDEADVLFFDSKNNKQFAEIRQQLLLNDTIQMAYNRVEQFPSWTPHLTLGYPATPAHELEYEVGWVEFDRLAVLFDNYEGPEFRLSRQNRSDSEVTMSDTMVLGASAAEDVLAHYGVKGMKWGVRKAEKAQRLANSQQKYATKLASKTDGSGLKGARARSSQKKADALQKTADKKWEKVDKKWEKSIYSTRGAIAVHNNVADQMNRRGGILDKLNDDPRWKDADGKDIDLLDPANAAVHDVYMSEYLKAQSTAYTNAVRDVHGGSPSGKKTAEYVEYETDYGYEARIEVKTAAVKHATDENDDDLVFFAKLSPLGRVVKINEAESGSVNHTDLDLDGFMAHYGVKGMKWGVRKDESSATSGPQPVVITQKRPGTLAKASGGGGHRMTDDAVNSLSIRQKAKTSTTDSLSNAELKQAVERMQLEQKYAQLLYNSDRRSLGARFAAGFFGYKRYDGQKRHYEDSNERLGEILADTLQKARKPSN